MVPRLFRSFALSLCFLITLAVGVGASQTEPIDKEGLQLADDRAVMGGVSATQTADPDPQEPAVDPREPAAVIMSEGFEAVWPAAGWSRVDQSDTDGGQFLLGDRSCDAHTGGWAGWMVGGGSAGSSLSCGANYPPNLDTWAEFGPFSLANASSATLTFYIKGQAEYYGSGTCDFDYLFVGASTNGSSYNGRRYCGDYTGGTAGNGYWTYTINLAHPDFLGSLGQPSAWIAFNMRSDGSVQYSGLTIDDLRLDVTSSCATPGAPSLNNPANGATLSDTTPTFSWNGVANANTYDIQVDNNNDFSSLAINQTVGATSFTPGNPLAPGTYFWRVGANNTVGGCNTFGPWSAVRSFTISTSPTCFLLTLDHTGNGSDPTASPANSPGCASDRYTAGQTITLSANPASGWRVNNWQGTNNNSSSSTSNTTTMPAAAHTVRVNYVQDTGGTARAFLPAVQWGLTGFLGPLEAEPNNSTAQANGPILLNRNYQGFPNDLSDYFYFELTSARQVNITLADITGRDPQLQLRNAANQLVGDIDATPPYSLSRNLAAGRYYVRVVVVAENNSSVLYTLRVNAP